MVHSVSSSASSAGAGGFGAIYIISRADELAFKVVKTQQQSANLVEEFSIMMESFRFCHPRDQLFRIPSPIGCLPTPAEGESAGFMAGLRPGYDFPALKAAFIELDSSNAVYAMDRIPAMHRSMSQTLLKRYAPEHLDEEIVIARLYLGKETTINRSRFFNSRNFPIDLQAYNMLASEWTKLPTAATVANEMGRALSHINEAGFDGRDVEFVLAGRFRSSNSSDSTLRKWGFYVFDFNQMRHLLASVD